MLVEADHLRDGDRRVDRRNVAGAGRGTRTSVAFAPDLVVGVEPRRTTLDPAGRKRRGKRLTTVGETVQSVEESSGRTVSKRTTGVVAVIERERQVRAGVRANRTTLRDGPDVNQRVATSVVTSRRVRVDILVVADENVGEQDLVVALGTDVERSRERPGSGACYGH